MQATKDELLGRAETGTEQAKEKAAEAGKDIERGARATATELRDKADTAAKDISAKATEQRENIRDRAEELRDDADARARRDLEKLREGFKDVETGARATGADIGQQKERLREDFSAKRDELRAKGEEKMEDLSAKMKDLSAREAHQTEKLEGVPSAVGTGAGDEDTDLGRADKGVSAKYFNEMNPVS